jgi:DNA-binding response OmpR family regulator
MSGLEVMKRARAIDREVGIIVVTAVHDEELGREALTLGAFDFITKPIDFIYLDRCLLHKIALMTL